MDVITKVRKLQTINSYKTRQFAHNLVSHSLTALTCTLLYSYPYWLPSLRSSFKQLLFLSVPKMLSSFFCPKWLFIVVNVIVVYLVGQSKLLGSLTPSCSSGQIYDEYIERSRSFRRSPDSIRRESIEQSKLEFNLAENGYDFDDNEEEEEVLTEEDKHQVPDEEQEEEEKKQDREDEVVEEDSEEQKEKVGDEEIGLPDDELNKRIEEFIARINKQRWLEEKMLVCCMA